MSLTVYESGTLVTTSAAFVNEAGAATDPDTITLKYRKGAGATTTVVYPAGPIVRDAQGDYHADLDTAGWAGPCNQVWTAEWFGVGAVVALKPDYWAVKPPALV